MKEPISQERWELAQSKEIPHHVSDSLEYSIENYRRGYEICFDFLNIDTDLKRKSVCEIGPARIPALYSCTNYAKSYIIEPLVFQETIDMMKNKNVELIHDKAETCDFPDVDEVWLINLLQHVQDPDLLVEKMKTKCKIIRFFEPICDWTNDEHPHAFSFEDYVKYFGDCTKKYVGGSIPNFHTADCAYGIYYCQNNTEK